MLQPVSPDSEAEHRSFEVRNNYSKGNLEPTDKAGAAQHETVAAFATYVNLLVLPIITFVGLAGNFSAIVVILKTSLRRLPSNLLLVALAVCDAGFVITTLFLWIEFIGYIRVHSGTPVGCKLLTFMAQFCDLASVWFIVGVSFERFIILFYPRLRGTLATNQFAIKYIVSVFIISALLTLWSLVTSGVVHERSESYCDTNLDLTTYQIFNISDTIISCFLPSLIILTLNFLIARKLGMFINNSKTGEEAVLYVISECSVPLVNVATNCEDSKNKTRMTVLNTGNTLQHDEAEQPTGRIRLFSNNRRPPIRNPVGGTGGSEVDGGDQNQKVSRSLTRAISSVATIYVMLNLPCYIVRIASSYIAVTEKGTTFDVLEIVSYVTYYSHHSLNFFFLTFFSPQMRRALRKILRQVAKDCCNIPGLRCSVSEDASAGNELEDMPV